MQYLATMQPFLAQALVEKLHEVGIAAESTEHGPGMGDWIPGLSNLAYTVWVRDSADLPEARKYLQEIRDVPREHEHCDECGYDLRGHAGEDMCPECGAEILVNDPKDWWTCPLCGEASPPAASECWKCTDPTHVESAAEPARTSEQQKVTGKRIAFWIFAIFLAVLILNALFRVFTEWF